MNEYCFADCCFVVDLVSPRRIGQKANIVRIIYMLARGTADDEMWSLAQNKLAVLESTLGKLYSATHHKLGYLNIGPRIWHR